MARISELHYSNSYASNGGGPEFLEVALGSGEDPADFTVGFYEEDGSHGLDINLQVGLNSGKIVEVIDAENNEKIYVLSSTQYSFFLTAPVGNQAGNYEAFALTNISTSTVLDFYDIGVGATNISPTGGVAGSATSPAVITSTNIPVSGNTTSIQFNQPNPTVAVQEAVSPGDTGLACFVSGVELMTPQGPVAVEDLSVGDLVITRDHGPMPIRWCGRQSMPATGRMAPIRISAGRYGATKDIEVSPQHRVLLTGWEAELLFGEPEVLVPAKALLDDQCVRQMQRETVTYHHILFDTHQIVESHGFWSESYYPVAHDSAGWSDATQSELLAIFPQLEFGKFGPLARPTVPVQLAKLLRNT